MTIDTKSLDDLRRDIDEIDTQIHDLLMHRTEIGQQIGVLKGDTSFFLRPGREAQILRRLVERHRGAFPKPVLVQIWREIISATTGVERSFSVAAYVPEDGIDLRGLAREHFGAECRITAHRSASGVLRAVAEGATILGVLPAPEAAEGAPWWRGLARDGEGVPRIVARLPFAAAENSAGEAAQGLAVALAEQDVSGHDRSYLIVETEERISRSALHDLLAEVGLDARHIIHWDDAPDRQLSLVRVGNFVGAGDPRLGALVEVGAGTLGHCWVIGGYSVPLTREELKPGKDAR